MKNSVRYFKKNQKHVNFLTLKEASGLGLMLGDVSKFELLDDSETSIYLSFFEEESHRAHRAARKASRKSYHENANLVVANLKSSTKVGFWTMADYEVFQYHLKH